MLRRKNCVLRGLSQFDATIFFPRVFARVFACVLLHVIGRFEAQATKTRVNEGLLYQTVRMVAVHSWSTARVLDHTDDGHAEVDTQQVVEAEAPR